MATINRRAYAEMYGPTTGDRLRLADTELVIEVERDFTLLAGGHGEEVKFGGGKTIRDGMGQSQRINGIGPGDAVDCVITNALIVDHWGIVKADIGIRGQRIFGHRQGRQPGRAAGREHRHRPGHRDHRRRRHDRHRRRHRQPHPLDLPAADRRSADVGHHDDARRRHRPGHRHLRHHLHARAGEHRPHAAGGRRLPDEPGLLRQGQREPARGAGAAGRGRRHRAEAARGLGHDAGGDRQLPDAWPRTTDVQVAIHTDTLNEIGLRRGHDRRLQGPHDPHLPHRRRRRRPCAGHHEGGRRGQRAAVVDQPDAALHRQHDRRAPRHADGLPPPRRRRSPRTWPSPKAASAARPSPPRTCCTTWARSA